MKGMNEPKRLNDAYSQWFLRLVIDALTDPESDLVRDLLSHR